MNQEGLVSAFLVKFDNLAELKFRSCHGMQFQVQPIYYPDSSLVGGCRTGRGQLGVSQLSFNYGTVDGSGSGGGGRSVSDWLMSVVDFDQKLDKRNGRVTLRGSEDETLAQWKIINAWPSSWNGPGFGTQDTDLSIDTITFVHEGIERLR